MKQLLFVLIASFLLPTLVFAASPVELACMRQAYDFINQETARISSVAKAMDTSSRVAALQQSHFVFAENSKLFKTLPDDNCPADMQTLTNLCYEKLSAAAAQSEKLYDLALSIGLAEGGEKTALIGDFNATATVLQQLQPEVFDLLKQLNMYFDKQGVL